MKKFLIKTGLFLVPIIVLIGYTIKYYNFEQGDLVRMSYLKSDYDYSVVFNNEYNNTKRVIFNDSSVVSVVKKKKWKFFTIGDSFTQQSIIGYVDKLSAKYPNDVVSFKSHYQHEGDPMSTLYAMIKSDYFDSVKVEYVIYQCVERYSVYRGAGLNRDVQLGYSEIQEKIAENEKNRLKASKNPQLKKEPYPTDRFIKFPLNNILYKFKSTGNNQLVYQEKLSTPLFSTSNNNVLFFHEDIDILPYNNDAENVKKLNDNLNEMALLFQQKGIQLIVLIAPDKFDLYYPYIVNNKKYTKPLFFEHFNKLEKKYLYVDAYSILKKKLEQKAKDIYLYDDSHWSPWATEIIATEIKRVSEVKK